MNKLNNQNLSVPNLNIETISSGVDNVNQFNIFTAPIDVVEVWLEERKEQHDSMLNLIDRLKKQKSTNVFI